MNDIMNISWLQPSARAKTRPVASKITIKQFYLPAGSSTQLKGVLSDIVLPSVNEFLPIGESDLPHALPWNSIDAVNWEKDWEDLTLSDSEEPGLETILAGKSEQRQQSLEEFAFLQKQIEWRRQRYEEKAISLNLKQRIARKIKDQTYIDQLDEAYDKLAEDAYESEDFILKVAEEQDALSKKNLEANGNEPELTEKENDEEDEEKEEEEERPDFDIYVRESTRIMADWIVLQSCRGQSSNSRIKRFVTK